MLLTEAPPGVGSLEVTYFILRHKEVQGRNMQPKKGDMEESHQLSLNALEESMKGKDWHSWVKNSHKEKPNRRAEKRHCWIERILRKVWWPKLGTGQEKMNPEREDGEC
jgi:hypothetical protein